MRKGAVITTAAVGLLGCWVATLYVAVLVTKSRVPVKLPLGMRVDTIAGYVHATGTWTIEGQRQAFPLQTTEIWCSPETRLCSVATADVSFGDILTVDVQTLPVTTWTRTQLVFSNDLPSCVGYVYTIDLATKTVNGVRRRNEAAPAGLGCNDLEKELRLTLRDGYSVWLGLDSAAMPLFGRVALAPFALFR